MSEVIFDLPDALAREAKDAGILRSDYVASLLRKEIQRRKVNRFFATIDRLVESDDPPTEAEIKAEIEAHRKERLRS